MPIVFEHDFEDNSLATYDAQEGSDTAVIQTSVVYQGARALRSELTAGQIRLRKNITATATAAFQAYLYRNADDETPYLIQIANSDDSDSIGIRFHWNDLFELQRVADSSEATLDSAAWATTTWYKIDVRVDASANPWVVNWKVDDVEQGEHNVSSAATTFNHLYIGAWIYDMNFDVYHDAVKLSDENAYITGGRTYKRLYGPAQLTNTAADLYTCPASTITRTLHIHASNPSGSPVDANLSIGADATATRVWDDLEIPSDSVEDVFDPYELAAGEKIQGWADTAGTVVVTITGYEDPV